MQMFIEQGIHNTRDQSGLLVMLSELEHQVVILGDAGIHQKVGDAGWEGYIERIVTGLKGGRAARRLLPYFASVPNWLPISPLAPMIRTGWPTRWWSSMKKLTPFLLVFALSAPALALEVPTLTSRVMDEVGILGSAQTQIEQMLTAHERATGQQFALLIIPTLEEIPSRTFQCASWKHGS